MVSSMVGRMRSSARTIGSSILLLLVAYFSFVVDRSNPPSIFWDENYHITSAERYLEGIAQFEPHPPLGFMLIAAGEAISTANRGIDKRALVKDKVIRGENLPSGFSFSGMRLLPSWFAALGVLLFFGLMLEITQNRLHALLFSMLYVCENAFVAHFRAAHLESFQLFFSMASIWLFVHLWLRSASLRWFHYGALGTLIGLSIMIKLNSVALILLVPVLFARDTSTRGFQGTLRTVAGLAAKGGAAALAAVAVALLTFSFFVLTARTLPDADTSAGRQDLAAMSPGYRMFLEREAVASLGSILAATRDYFRFMAKDHHGVPRLSADNPNENGSPPLHWVIHERTINYRWDSANGLTSYVQLSGNLISWCLGFVSLVLSILLIVNHRVFALPLKCSQETYQLVEVLSGLYLVFMLVSTWMSAQRVMYLYHYFTGLLISFLLTALMWRYLSEQYAWSRRVRTFTATALASLIVLSFLFFLPLSKHWPLTKEQCERRNVFAVIVKCQ
jgi:dolichyl-phosphate-mannose-protein mannosyltransferase